MYATVKDFEKIKEDLIELIPLGESFDEGTLTGLIIAASEEIDNYLRSQYKTPLSPVPTTIKRYCFNITKYYLYSDHARVIPEEIESVYKSALASLKSISKGESQLAGLDNNKPVETADAKVIKYGSKYDNLGYFN